MEQHLIESFLDVCPCQSGPPDPWASATLTSTAAKDWSARESRAQFDSTLQASTVQDLLTYIKDSHQEVNRATRAVAKYYDLRQTKSVAQFKAELDEAYVYLKEYPNEQSRIEKFRQGLKNSIRVKLDLEKDIDDWSYDEIVRQADRIDQVEFHSRKRINAISDGSRQRNDSKKPDRKDKEGWSAWCRDKNACFNCGMTGHKSFECRSKGRGRDLSAGDTNSSDRAFRWKTNRVLALPGPSVY